MSVFVISCVCLASLCVLIIVVAFFPQQKFKKFFSALDFRGESDKLLPRHLRTKRINKYICKTDFRSRIPLQQWEKIKPHLELFRRKMIYKIEQSKNDLRTVSVYFIASFLPPYIEWNDGYMEEESTFAIGESYMGKVLWDAAAMPHGLIGGSTGSGKTGLLRCIIHQAILKRWNVSVMDFKGGGDYTGVKEKYLDLTKGYGPFLVTEPEEARDLLLGLTIEVKGRLSAFKEAGVFNIFEYNKSGRGSFVPWLVVIDEAAELLDVHPTGKAEKEMYAEIDHYLRTLARISRAAGVHILMGFIRPDANILNGQIKNNLIWRVCGYFPDPAASRIVLDNDRATELPPEIKGRFIVGSEEVQAYYFPVPKLNQELEET